MADERIRLELDLGQSTAATREFGAALQSVQVVADQGVAPALVRVDQSAQRAAMSHADFGRTILQTSYAVQDFTAQLGTRGLGGALAAIQNNIPLLVMGLGAGAGLTGVISVLSVGVGVLYDNWGKIATLWGQGHTEEEAKRLEKLKDAAEKAREATDKLFKTPAPEQMEMGRRIDKAVSEFGGPAVLDKLTELYKKTFGDFGDRTPQLTKDLVEGARRGDRQAIGFIEDMTRFDGGDVAMRLRGEPTARERADVANRVRVREQRQAFEAQEARAKFERDTIDRIQQEDEAARRMQARDRVQESIDLGRRFGRAAEAKQRDAGRAGAANAREEMSARREIARLQEQIGQAQERETRGLASHVETQQVVWNLQGQVSQLQAQLRQVMDNNKRLQTRNNLLDRGR